jgi:hypothetical protein
MSVTEPSQLMLRKFCRFYGGDNEERRLLGYKATVLTSHETYYFCYRAQLVNVT